MNGPIVHDRWEAVYRSNPLQDQLNATLMDRVLAWVKPARGRYSSTPAAASAITRWRLPARGFQVVGVDISSNVLKQAADNLERCGYGDRVTFRCESLEKPTVLPMGILTWFTAAVC